MEKVELKKRLEKKKAYLVCCMIFLALSAPSLLGLCAHLGASPAAQLGVLSGIFVLIALIYKKMNQVRGRIKTLFR